MSKLSECFKSKDLGADTSGQVGHIVRNDLFPHINFVWEIYDPVLR